MIWVILGIGIGIAVAVVLTVLRWKTISDWLQEQKLHAACAEIKRRLDSGHYTIEAGVFTNSGLLSKAWVTDSLDEELRNKFGNQSQIVVQI